MGIEQIREMAEDLVGRDVEAGLVEEKSELSVEEFRSLLKKGKITHRKMGEDLAEILYGMGVKKHGRFYPVKRDPRSFGVSERGGYDATGLILENDLENLILFAKHSTHDGEVDESVELDFGRFRKNPGAEYRRGVEKLVDIFSKKYSYKEDREDVELDEERSRELKQFDKIKPGTKVKLVKGLFDTEKDLIKQNHIDFEFVRWAKPHGYAVVRDKWGSWHLHPESLVIVESVEDVEITEALKRPKLNDNTVSAVQEVIDKLGKNAEFKRIQKSMTLWRKGDSGYALARSALNSALISMVERMAGVRQGGKKISSSWIEKEVNLQIKNRRIIRDTHGENLLKWAEMLANAMNKASITEDVELEEGVSPKRFKVDVTRDISATGDIDRTVGHLVSYKVVVMNTKSGKELAKLRVVQDLRGGGVHLQDGGRDLPNKAARDAVIKAIAKSLGSKVEDEDVELEEGKKYYLLVGKNSKNRPFEVVFGDFDKETVEDEKEDERGNWKSLKIISLRGGSQSFVDAALKKLNEDVELDSETMKVEKYIEEVAMYEAKMSKEEKKAFELGEKAFGNGLKRIPVMDKVLKRMLVGRKIGGGSAELMKAWLRGWDKANLAAPVEDIENEDVELEEAKKTYLVNVTKYFRGIGDQGRVVKADSEKEAIKMVAKVLKKKPSYLEAELIESDEDVSLEEARDLKAIARSLAVTIDEMETDPDYRKGKDVKIGPYSMNTRGTVIELGRLGDKKDDVIAEFQKLKVAMDKEANKGEGGKVSNRAFKNFILKLKAQLRNLKSLPEAMDHGEDVELDEGSLDPMAMMKAVKSKIKGSKYDPKKWVLVLPNGTEVIFARIGGVKGSSSMAVYRSGKMVKDVPISSPGDAVRKLSEDVELDEANWKATKIGSNEKTAVNRLKKLLSDYEQKKAGARSPAHRPSLSDDKLEPILNEMGKAFRKDLKAAGAKLVNTIRVDQGAKEILNGTPFRYVVFFSGRPMVPGNNDPKWREKEAAVKAWDDQYKTDVKVLRGFGLKGGHGSPGKHGKNFSWWADRDLVSKLDEDVELDEAVFDRHDREYSEFGPAQEKAMKLKRKGAKNIKLEKKRGKWVLSYSLPIGVKVEDVNLSMLREMRDELLSD